MENNVPPLPSTPPPLIPPATAPRSRGKVWVWLVAGLAIIAVVGILILSKLANSLSFAGVGHTGSGRTDHSIHEVLIENNRSDHKIAVIDVDGVITGQAWDGAGRNMVDLIEDELKMAAEDSSVRAVILKVDSPGGEVLASDDISRAITKFQDSSDKPVIASMGGLAASGGYYVSAPCRWIVANELTMTGSIGVIMHGFNYRGLMDKVGIAPQVFKSGKFKDMLSGSKLPSEIDPKEREMVQSMIDETFEKFKTVVADGRGRAAQENQGEGRPLAKNWFEYADGRIMSGKQAFELGFVDELGNFDAAVDRAKKLAAISSANLIHYQQVFDFSNFLSLFGQAESRSIKVELGMDLPKLQAGRLYFLAPTFLH